MPAVTAAKKKVIAAATTPPYIQRGGEQEIVPPCMLYSTQFYIFILQGNQTNLQNLIDRLFNTPSGGKVKYKVFSDFVALMFTHVDKLTSSEASQGWAAYGDIALWVPVFSYGEGIIPKFKMYPAYMIVDNSTTMATGREIFGFPKEMGSFLVPQTPNFIGDLLVDVQGYAANSSTQQTFNQRLWTMQRGNPTKDPKTQPLKNGAEAVKALMEALKAGGLTLKDELLVGFDLLDSLLSFQALGLRQVRDITNPTQAAYQAIVEAPLGYKGFRGAKLLLDPYTFILNDLVTHPVAADTGLKIGPQAPIFAVWLHLDMELGTGTVQWEYKR